jgi:hypothetical protein
MKRFFIIVFLKAMKYSPFLLVVVWGVMLYAVDCRASGRDTITNFDARGGYIYYNDPAIAMQAARFELSRSGEIRRIMVTLGGNSANGTAVLHVFGHEGGMAAPVLEHDMAAPITVHKTRAGVETVDIVLERPIPFNAGQLFIALEKIAPGVTLISDRRTKRPSCIAPPDQFYFQMFKSRSGAWRWGKFGFGISLEVDYDPAPQNPYFRNVTTERLPGDSIAGNRNIAWGDLNNDGFIDLVYGGRIFRNQHGERFEEITSSVGAHGIPQANVLIDMDNDGDMDVVFLGIKDSTSGEGMVFVNSGDGSFISQRLDLPPTSAISSCSVADADGDGFLDIFVGQKFVSGDLPTPNYLLINNGKLGFINGSDKLIGRSIKGNDCSGSQWADMDGDGVPELFVAQRGNSSDELWQRTEEGSYVDRISASGIDGLTAGSNGRIGCHWGDYDNNGVADLLMTRRLSPTGRGRTSAYTPVVHMAGSGMRADGMGQRAMMDYEERPGGASWCDVNNDGLLDYLVTTACDCRYAALYVQMPGGDFVPKTAEAGLGRLSLGEDAVWADYDNDGRLDLATFLNGRLVLFRNEWPSEANSHVILDLRGGDVVGSRVEVFAGGHHYARDVVSGRGEMMQEPSRLTFGLDDARRVDSVIVHWRGGGVQRYDSLQVGAINTLVEGVGSVATASSVAEVNASPNPFSSVVHFSYSLATADRVVLDIRSLDGELVTVLLDEKQSAGDHDVAWNGHGRDGERVAQGAYIYRLHSSGGDLTGKVVLVH